MIKLQAHIFTHFYFENGPINVLLLGHCNGINEKGNAILKKT